MTASLPHEELSGVRELLESFMSALDAESPKDVAALELVALGIQAPFAWPEAPPELARELPRALAQRGDRLACDLLLAIERLAPQPLAGFAAVQRDRLEAEGVEPVFGGEIGTLAVAEASVLPAADGEAELWHVVLRRPSDGGEQALVAFVEHESCGAVIVGLTLGAPGDGDLVSGFLDVLGPAHPEAIAAEELAGRLRAALDHMERHAVPLDVDAGQFLPLLERALTGRAGRMPRPPVDPPDGDEELRHGADALVEAFAAALEEDDDLEPALREHGPFVAHCMLDWKIDQADRRLERWTLGDLRELLLDWLPQEAVIEDEAIAVTADAVTAFLHFLAAEERLDAPVPLDSLEGAVARLRPRFEQAAREPRNWGPAKALAVQMAADGLTMADPEAVQDWIAEFNARPFEERDAVLGPALATADRAPAPKRAKRKAAKQARKRNRR